jgi:hypothetical protein
VVLRRDPDSASAYDPALRTTDRNAIGEQIVERRAVCWSIKQTQSQLTLRTQDLQIVTYERDSGPPSHEAGSSKPDDSHVSLLETARPVGGVSLRGTRLWILSDCRQSSG